MIVAMPNLIGRDGSLLAYSYNAARITLDMSARIIFLGQALKCDPMSFGQVGR
jgi:hypothetical protein